MENLRNSAGWDGWNQLQPRYIPKFLQNAQCGAPFTACDAWGRMGSLGALSKGRFLQLRSEKHQLSSTFGILFHKHEMFVLAQETTGTLWSFNSDWKISMLNCDVSSNYNGQYFPSYIYIYINYINLHLPWISPSCFPHRTFLAGRDGGAVDDHIRLHRSTRSTWLPCRYRMP